MLISGLEIIRICLLIRLVGSVDIYWVKREKLMIAIIKIDRSKKYVTPHYWAQLEVLDSQTSLQGTT